MTVLDRGHCNMKKSTAFLIISLLIVNQGSDVTAQDGSIDEPIAMESKNRVVTVISGPKYVTQPPPNSLSPVNPTPQALKPQPRPPSKPPNIPSKPPKPSYHVDPSRPHSHIQNIPPPWRHPKLPIPHYYAPNSLYKFPRVIPLPPHYRKYYYKPNRPLLYAASSGKPTVAKSPKFSLPVQVVNGIRTDIVKPPKTFNATTAHTTTTTELQTTTEATTTTQKVMRTKRIWPKHTIEKTNSTNTTLTEDDTTLTIDNITLTKTYRALMRSNTTKTNVTDDNSTSESHHRPRYSYRNATVGTTTVQPSSTRRYQPVTRTPKVKTTTTTTTISPVNYTQIEKYNDWVPILPSHYTQQRLKRPLPTPINKRSDIFSVNSKMPPSKQMMYLQSFGLLPMDNAQSATPAMARKKMVFFKRKRQLNPHYSGSSPRPGRLSTRYSYGDLDGSQSRTHSHPRVITKIKHHHHHHHHRYIKTVEKPVRVPYKVEVPKPYPVPVEKKVPVPVEKVKVVDRPVPYPVTVEKKVPYPIGIKVPHPVPVKVVEKEYVPKPYPVVHHVPVVKHVEVKVPHPVPVPVERKVPYPVPVKVPVPVDRPVPVPIHIEKQVPYAVPVKVLVPQPYPVEKKVPYPVEVKVKEPIEVIKHVPIRVPYPQPYPVKVPHPVPVHIEKKVPYPVEVEKKVPVPYEVIVPQRIEVEKKVPVYIPKPYPVEKRVPVPVRVPYPVKVPVRVPVHVPVYVDHLPYEPRYSESMSIPSTASDFSATTHSSIPPHTVTVHGNTGFTGFQDRSDDSTTALAVTTAS